MRIVQDRIHLIWADKIVLWLAFAAIVIAAVGWCLVAVAAGVGGANHVVTSFSAESGDDLLVVLLTLWVALRAIDFLRGGQTRTLFATHAHLDETARSPAVGNDLAHHF